MSIRMRRCVMFHPSSMKRTITAITSLCLLLGSKITDRSLVISTSPGTDSSSILYPSNFLLENEGYVLPETDATGKSIAIFSNKGRGLYIFPMGILDFKNSSITSCRYARSVRSSVRSWWLFSRLSASVLVCSLNFDFLIISFPLLACFLEAQLQWDDKMLFFLETTSVQVVQNIVLPLTLRCWPGNWLMRSCM